MVEFEWERLSRRPDIEADNLFAADAADRLILDTAADAVAGCAPRDVVIIGDAYGALTLATGAVLRAGTNDARGGTGSVRADGTIRVHQDPLVAERALEANAAELGRPGSYRSMPLVPELVAGARVVLLRLPKSLDALDEIAALVAGHGHPEAVVFAGGMQKHMTVAQNDVLGRFFERVDVGRARQKARVLTVRGPRADAAVEGAWPQRQFHADVAPGLWVCAHGGAFAGTRIDIGTRFLLSHLDEARPDAATAVDLACGTGAIASLLALRRPGIRVIATDQSAVAAASARATAEANGVADRIEVRREDSGEGVPAGFADLVLLNPPFHNGAALDLRVGRMLVAAAARLLAPGGELWTVYNSHLDYRPTLNRTVGPTRQVDRNTKFTVTVSVR